MACHKILECSWVICLHVRLCKKAAQEGAKFAKEEMDAAAKAIKNEIDNKENLSKLALCVAMPILDNITSVIMFTNF